MRSPYTWEQVTVFLGHEVLRVPVGADRWARNIVSGSGTLGLVTGLVEPRVADRLIDAVLDGHLSPQEVQDAAAELLSTAAPYTWWKTARLLSLSCRPDICGHLTLAGMDPVELTVAQWCAATYALVTRNSDEKDQFKTDVALDEPPPGVADDVRMTSAEFDDMVAAARALPGQQ